MARYRWALRPGWIASHLFVGACVVLFVILGLWQMRRLDERRHENAVIEARQTEVARPIQQVIHPDADAEMAASVQYRNVTAAGTYNRDEQVLIRNRTYDGAPGYEVVTPLVLGDGSAVAVNRGWIPLTTGDDAAKAVDYEAPTGPVTVHGLVALSQQQEGLGVSDPPDGKLAGLARVDLPRLQKQTTERLLPVFITVSPQPVGVISRLPVPQPPAVLDDGPHLNYAGQWFIFAVLTCVVYPLLLRRTARHKDQERREAEHAGGPAPVGPAG